MYGEAPSNAIEEQATAPIGALGGVVLISSRQWPRTDENCLPTRLRETVDTNSDGITDHVATLSVKLVDLDGNGKWERGIDGVKLDPICVERIDANVQLCFSPADWKRTVKRGAAGL